MKNLICCLCLIGTALGLYAQPTTDIVDRSILDESPSIEYAPLREADLFWERKVWRVIDVREKMNLVFSYPAEPLFDILKTEALAGDLNLYDPSVPNYGKPLSKSELDGILYRIDTIRVVDANTQKSYLQEIKDDINTEDIRRYRIEEIWYFDSKMSTLGVRIIGIAPMLDTYDENGNFLYEKPLFWVNFPESRVVLDQYEPYNILNESSRMSWADLLDMRQFSSVVYKGPDLRDRRLLDIYSGVDLLIQAERIDQEIFNFEHDLWSR